MTFSKKDIVKFGDEEWVIKDIVNNKYLLENPSYESFYTTYRELLVYNEKRVENDMTGVTNDDR